MAKKEKEQLISKDRNDLLQKMSKKYKRNIHRESSSVSAWSSGILSLDVASGIGGHRKGGIIEIFGKESSGKSLIALQAIATAQRKYNKPSVYFDLEFATPKEWMELHGIDFDFVDVPDPENGEQVFDMALDLIRSNYYAYIVIDSLVAAVPKAVLDGEVGDAHVGVDARMIAQGLRKIVPAISAVETNLLIVNQIRSTIGGFGGFNPETTPGGKALKFYASQRLKTNKVGAYKRSGEVAGHTAKTKYVKNKSAPPQRVAEFKLDYSQPVDNSPDLVVYGVKFGVIEKGGNTFDYKGEKFTSNSKIIEALQNDAVLANMIWDDILEALHAGKLSSIDDNVEMEDSFFEDNDDFEDSEE